MHKMDSGGCRNAFPRCCWLVHVEGISRSVPAVLQFQHSRALVGQSSEVRGTGRGGCSMRVLLVTPLRCAGVQVAGVQKAGVVVICSRRARLGALPGDPKELGHHLRHPGDSCLLGSRWRWHPVLLLEPVARAATKRQKKVKNSEKWERFSRVKSGNSVPGSSTRTLQPPSTSPQGQDSPGPYPAAPYRVVYTIAKVYPLYWCPAPLFWHAASCWCDSDEPRVSISCSEE